MNKALLLSLVLFCCGLQMQAQTLTEAEVTAKMNEAFALNNAKKTAEALDAFLIVGKNTEQQRNEVEHQVYVCSQTMSCMCYETLKRYEEAYLLAKKLMSGSLTEKEKKRCQSSVCHERIYVCHQFYARRQQTISKGSYYIGRDYAIR